MHSDINTWHSNIHRVAKAKTSGVIFVVLFQQVFQHNIKTCCGPFLNLCGSGKGAYDIGLTLPSAVRFGIWTSDGQLWPDISPMSNTGWVLHLARRMKCYCLPFLTAITEVKRVSPRLTWANYAERRRDDLFPWVVNYA